VAAAEGARVARAKITRFALIGAAAAFIAAAVLPAAEPADDPVGSLFDLIGDNEVPNSVFDDLLGVGADVVTFLMRMVPG
jgi:hypothetical protein